MATIRSGLAFDLVVLLPDLSDVQDEIEYAAQYRFAADGEPLVLASADHRPAVRWLYNHLALARWARREQLHLQGRTLAAETAHAGREVVLSAMDSARLAASGPLAYSYLPRRAGQSLRHTWVDHRPSIEGWAGEGLRRMRENIARTHRLAARHGIQLVVVVYPWPQVLYTEHDPARYEVLRRTFPRWFHEREMVHGTRPSTGALAYREAIEGQCRERSIPFVDLFPRFAGRPDWPRLFLPGDVHFSPEGSRLVGREVAAALRQVA